MSTDKIQMTLYRCGGADTVIRPAGVRREWMDQTPSRFTYRCLPMAIANQHGWVVEAPHRIEVAWTGGPRPQDVIVRGPAGTPAQGHFGSGVLTFSMPWLVRTPPGWNLLVRGPANNPKDGIIALEGLVETDHAVETFTMNWRFTRPCSVVFEQGETIAMFVPQRRGDLERFEIVEQPISSDPELHDNYRAWSASRNRFNADLKVPGSEAEKKGWQRSYMRDAHQTKLPLCPHMRTTQ